MTGAEFLAYVRRILKRTDKDTEIYEATTDVIADIRLQLNTEDYKEEAYSAGIATLGEYKIGLPADFGHLIGTITMVDNTGGTSFTLTKLSKAQYDDKYPDRLFTDTSDQYDGVPQDFCIYGKQIFLGPVPDSTSYRYYLNYTTEDFAAIAADTDPVPFTDRYRSMLRAGVLAEVYSGLEFFDEANYWRQMYVDGLVKLKANDDSNINDDGMVVYHGI